MRALYVALLLLASIVPSLADVWIEASPGGNVGEFVDLFAMLRRSGERVVIDGPCYSACTLVVSVIPRSRLCVTRRAVLGFHAPRLIDLADGKLYSDSIATRAMIDAYPAPIRDWIIRHGNLTNHLIYLRGRELAAFYPRCR